MPEKDDRFYIEKVLEGDTAAFAALVERHKNNAFSLALRITGNREDAEEIAMDAFVKVYRSLGSFRNDSKFTTWLYRIVHNESISVLRKKQPETTPLEDNLADDYPSDDIHYRISVQDEIQQQQLISRALNELPPADHLLITLFYMEDQSVGEISQITGLSQANIKVRLYRTRKRLYQILNRIQCNVPVHEKQIS
ncbi:MAG: sigma-70 family RNA polymerase sigma factor [Bacteroidales bacterium]|nr:sigma-70 family RNA polymerase sigma factor [Lentimicrobiaceae bacterium]MDD5694763.1 sigma-70 family RNA polymerase sigma factor [Bacteroidales bacterium]